MQTQRTMMCGAAASLLLLTGVSLAGEPYFQGLGHLAGGDTIGSWATAMSADGSVVVGDSVSYPGLSGIQAFRWTPQTGMLGLGEFPGGFRYSEAYGVSPNGRYVVGGSASDQPGGQAFFWSEATGMLNLGGLPGGLYRSKAFDVSDTGVAVGDAIMDSTGRTQAFRWTMDGGMRGLGYLPGGTRSNARGVSADGAVIVGWSDSSAGDLAFHWTEPNGMVSLGDLPGGLVGSAAYGMSRDGRYIVGQSVSDRGFEAFIWSEATGMTGLGFLPTGSYSTAASASTTGVVVGIAHFPPGGTGFVWDQHRGMRTITDVLLEAGFDVEASGWRLDSVYDVSADGLTFTGTGLNPDGYAEAWIAHIPAPSTLGALGLALLGLRRRRRRGGGL